MSTAVVEAGPVSMGKLSALPGNPPLKYPASARMRHQEGVVRLRILVATDGHVADIGIAQSSGFEILDKAALEVVRRWRFQPPTRDGQPVEGIGIFPAAFRLAA
jgi:protein TonB